MRTVLFLIAGFLLLATFFNMWVGATRDGYSWGKELSLFLVVFGIPAVVAIGFKCKLL